MAGKGLGAGLGALFGDSADIKEASEKQTLPISKIEPRKDQPRQYFDEAQLSELAASIKEHGVIQPLTVREIDGGYYQIIAGERRWRASRMAGLTELPVHIIKADDKTAMIYAMVENLQREDLNPIEEAKGYKTLISSYGLTQQAAADAVGKSRPVVTNALRLLTLPEKIISYLENGELSVSQARLLLEISDENELLAIADKAVEKGLTVREISSLINKQGKVKETKGKSRKSADGVDYYAIAEKKLSDKFGRRVKINCGRKKGKIEIEYYGDEDFEALLDVLSSVNKK